MIEKYFRIFTPESCFIRIADKLRILLLMLEQKLLRRLSHITIPPGRSTIPSQILMNENRRFSSGLPNANRTVTNGRQMSERPPLQRGQRRTNFHTLIYDPQYCIALDETKAMLEQNEYNSLDIL
jgi:hypothetical protein